MRAALVIAGLALPAAAAYVAIGRALGRSGDLASRVLRAGLSVPLGIGASSVLAYAWLVAGGSLGPAYALSESVVLAAVMASLRPWVRPAAAPATAPLGAIERAAIAVAGLGLALAAVAFVQGVVVDPAGDWDSWSIWNNHARFLYRGNREWTVLFHPLVGWSHNEYPLLVPSAVARLWSFSGETPIASWGIAGAFWLSTALVLYGALARRSGHVTGATATLLLLATESWSLAGPAQYADVPLACLAAAGVACLAGARGRDEPGAGALALAGTFAGLGAWTKDEGVVLGALFGGWAVLTAARPSWRRVLAYASGAAVPLLVRIHFQAVFSPAFSAVFTSGQSIATVRGRIADPGRWSTIAHELPQYLPGSERWLPLAAIAAAVLLGARARGALRSPALPALAAWIAFTFVYAMTPLDVRWHMESSAPRVYLQAWPALLLGIFALVPSTAATSDVAVATGIAASPPPA